VKQAYVSVVMSFFGTNSNSSAEVITNLDSILSENTRKHEIVLCAPYNSPPLNLSEIELSGPVSVVYSNSKATRDEAIVAGLARAVGDFIIEWQGPANELGVSLISEFLTPTESGDELIEAEVIESSIVSKIFYQLTNSLRPSNSPVRKVTGRAYSRRALSRVLGSISFEPQLNVLFAELPVQRSVFSTRIPKVDNLGFRQRISEGMKLLAKGSRFGSVVPLSLAAISASFGIGVAIYALLLFLLRNKSPEGWTTLMIVTGLGMASILALLGLIWTRIDSLARGLSRQIDSTIDVVVIAPRK